MARSLNLEEAEVFNQDILATQKFPLINDSAEVLLKRRDTDLDLTSETGLWFACHFSGFREF